MIPSAEDCVRLAERTVSTPVLSWERDWFAEATAPDRGLVCLSCGRGNGKSLVAAALAAAWFQTLPGADVILVASSFEQGRIIGRDAAKMLRAEDPDEDLIYRNSSQRFEIEEPETETRLRVIGSNPGRAQGARAALMVGDEPAAWSAQGAEMLSVLLTARGKIPGSRVVLIGTRAGDPSHWWERLLDDPGPRSHVTLFAADPGVDPLDEDGWHAANPSLADAVLDIEQVRSEAQKATVDAAELQRFRALRLNSGVPIAENLTGLLDPGVWESLETLPDGPTAPQTRTGDYVLGLDLGATVSLSAAAAHWPETGRLEVLTCVGAEPSLVERGRKLGAPQLFTEACEQGHLLATPGRNADVAELLKRVIAKWGTPQVITADRWRRAELLDLLDELGMRCEIIWRGIGRKDSAEDTRAFQRAAHDGKVRPVRTELLDRSIHAARLTVDPAGNPKIKSSGRPDDLASASVLAVAEGQRRAGKRPQRLLLGRI